MHHSKLTSGGDPYPENSDPSDLDHVNSSASDPFEVGTELVDGFPMKVFVNRPGKLSDLLKTAASNPDKQCIIDPDTRYSYGAFIKEVQAIAGTLATKFGVSKGTRVGILASNRAEWVVSLWAILHCGGTVVALNSWWTEGEIEAALKASECTILIGDNKRIRRLSPLLDIPVISFDTPVDSTHHAFGALKSHTPLIEPVNVSENDIAAILFTSGTTGEPNGVLISHRAWIAGLMNSMSAIADEVKKHPELVGADTEVRILASLPFFHVGGGHGTAISGIVSGATIVIPPEKFDAETALQIIEDEKITRWSAVPTMVQAICQRAMKGGYDLSSLTTLGYGAAPSGESLLAKSRATFPSLVAVSNAYGLTECTSVVAMNTGKDFITRPDSVGRPFPITEFRIVDDKDQALEAGDVGNVQIRGAFLMSGYLTQSNDNLFAPGRWLRTGDIGYLDLEGFLFLVDRKKDVIIRGGENIFAGEVERRIEEHPLVIEAAVVAKPDERLGEEVRAVVRTTPTAQIDAGSLCEWVAAELAGFKVPTVVEFTQSPLPRNVAGKLLKRDIREMTFSDAAHNFSE